MSEKIADALADGASAARRALAFRLARDIDDPKTPGYARATMARVLADLLRELAEDDAQADAATEARRALRSLRDAS
jgi:hypothetical protein